MFTTSGDLFISGGTTSQNVVNNTYNILRGGRAPPRDKLLERTSPNAIHDSKELESQGICIENTREVVLGVLNDRLLASSPDSSALVWLNGPAGAGKSAIARTIARSASEEGRLLASFFFYASDPTRNTIDPLIPTLAIQVCRMFPQARPYIEEAIENDPLVFTKATGAQAEALIVRPLVRVLSEVPLDSTPLFILVDGLDECAESGKRIEVIKVLSNVITKVYTHTRIRLKLIVFSRPEHVIRTCVSKQKALKPMTVSLQDEDLNPRSDIEIYYQAHFIKIQEEHPIGAFLDDWPSPEEMTQLVDITDNHFAFAHTMRIFVANPNEDPRDQLQIVLGIARPDRESPHTHIDQLFVTVFSRVPQHLLSMTLRIIGAILIPAQCALFPSPPLLELVFSLKRGEIRQRFSYLESLFDLGDSTSSWIRVHHKTLADFLFNPSRSKEHGLFIDEDTVCEDIRQSVWSVFLREEIPSRESLTAFVHFLAMLSRQPDYLFPSQWTPEPSDRCVATQSTWKPWAFEIGNDFGFHRRIPILRGLGMTPGDDYIQQIRIGDESRDIRGAFPVYDCSAFGRVALVFCALSFWGSYDESVDVFYPAFVRHAIRSQPGLLELDETVGRNLVSCSPNNIAEVAICFYSSPEPYQSNVRMQVVRDTFDPDWVVSRLGMLLSWHEGGHQSSDNPWEHAARRDLVEVASESQLKCKMCWEVLEFCKAKMIGYCLCWTVHPDGTFYEAVYDYIQANPMLWNSSGLFSQWVYGLQDKRELLASDPRIANIADLVRKRREALDQARTERRNTLTLDGWDVTTAFYLADEPFSRACIPFDVPFDEHAARVSWRRAAWYGGFELPEVVYTYPDSS